MGSRLFIVSLLLGLSLFGSAAPARAEILVSAAASLTNALTTIAERFEAASGEKVVLNFGASNTLARQILSGARVDVFVSADEAQMDRVNADVAPRTRVNVLSNRLALAVARETSGITVPRDLLAQTVRRVAIG